MEGMYPFSDPFRDAISGSDSGLSEEIQKRKCLLIRSSPAIVYFSYYLAGSVGPSVSSRL